MDWCQRLIELGIVKPDEAWLHDKTMDPDDVCSVFMKLCAAPGGEKAVGEFEMYQRFISQEDGDEEAAGRRFQEYQDQQAEKDKEKKKKKGNKTGQGEKEGESGQEIATRVVENRFARKDFHTVFAFQDALGDPIILKTKPVHHQRHRRI